MGDGVDIRDRFFVFSNCCLLLILHALVDTLFLLLSSLSSFGLLIVLRGSVKVSTTSSAFSVHSRLMQVDRGQFCGRLWDIRMSCCWSVSFRFKLRTYAHWPLKSFRPKSCACGLTDTYGSGLSSFPSDHSVLHGSNNDIFKGGFAEHTTEHDDAQRLGIRMLDNVKARPRSPRRRMRYWTAT